MYIAVISCCDMRCVSVCALRYSVLNVSGKLGFWFSVRCDLQVIHLGRLPGSLYLILSKLCGCIYHPTRIELDLGGGMRCFA